MEVSRRRELLLLAAFTVLLHVPFLHQPVQGDEVTYLDIARHALEQPFTPLDFQYVFRGHLVDASGHPHPPFNAYLLALAWILRGHFSASFFHLYYLLFALGISFAAYALAARFTPKALWCALLVAASPIVQVNTNTLAGPESPALCFLLIGAAAFFWRRFWICGIALACAGLTELQAFALTPILLLEYLLRRERPTRAAWLALAAPFAGLAAWEALQWSLTGNLPGAVLAEYAQNPDYSALTLKLASAVALLGHLGVLVTPLPLAWRRLWALAPGVAACALVSGYAWWERALLLIAVSLGVNAMLWLWNARRSSPVLAWWCLLYFAFAAVVFFAGAARYLLPLAAPLVLLFVLQFQERTRWLWAALAVNLVLGLNISFAAYEFSRVYAEVQPPAVRPFLVNGEWGFRYYMLEKGGRVLETRSVPNPGEWIVASELSLAGKFDSLAEETAVTIGTRDVRVRTPLRLIDRYAHTGFSSASFGLLPFSFSSRPLDRITYSRTSSFLNVPGAWTPTQFSGRLVYVPDPGAEIRLPLDARCTLQFALFGRGQGVATYRIRKPSGETVLDRSVTVSGDIWEPHMLELGGTPEVVLSVDTPSSVRAGWGELVCNSDSPAAAGGAAKPAELSYLNLGDIRTRPQLLSGWYAVEDGGWRWMAKEAKVELRRPADPQPGFEVELFFPPDYMKRVGGFVTVYVTLNDQPLIRQSYAQAGGHRLAAPVPRERLASPVVRVGIRLSRAMPPSGSEQRELGAVVSRLGFVAAGR